MPEVRVLSFHARYRCRHAGACCTSNWPIPIEADRLARVARGAGRPDDCGRPSATGASAFDEPPDAPAETPALLGRARPPLRLLRSQRPTRDRRAVPNPVRARPRRLAARVPPVSARVRARSARRVGHALALLPDRGRTARCGPRPTTRSRSRSIAPAFRPPANTSASTRATALPPLLRRDMLMDWDVVVGVRTDWPSISFARIRRSGRRACTGCARPSRISQTWSPADGPLVDRVHRGLRARRVTRPRRSRRAGPRATDRRRLRVNSRRPQASATSPPRSRRHRCATRRFLAAHAFANWAIHLGGGLQVVAAVDRNRRGAHRRRRRRPAGGPAAPAPASRSAGVSFASARTLLRCLTKHPRLQNLSYSAPMNG